LYSAFLKFMYFSQYCLEMPPTAATYIITSCIQYINNKVRRSIGWRLKTIRYLNMQEKNLFISVLVFKLYGPLLYMPFFTKINIFSVCLCNTLHWYCSGLQRYIRSIIFTQLAILINFFPLLIQKSGTECTHLKNTGMESSELKYYHWISMGIQWLKLILFFIFLKIFTFF